MENLVISAGVQPFLWIVFKCPLLGWLLSLLCKGAVERAAHLVTENAL